MDSRDFAFRRTNRNSRRLLEQHADASSDDADDACDCCDGNVLLSKGCDAMLASLVELVRGNVRFNACWYLIADTFFVLNSYTQVTAADFELRHFDDELPNLIHSFGIDKRLYPFQIWNRRTTASDNHR